jgi:transcriptional regulator
VYIPAHFLENRVEVLTQLIHDHPFGLLVTLGAGGLDATPIPFVLASAGGECVLRGHVARANPVWRETQLETEALVVFQGPHGYVSPSWYATKADSGKVVPTWNYITVHARGRLHIQQDPVWLRTHVAELTQRHEGTRALPWALGDAPADYVDKLLAGIVGLELPVRELSGKWKLSQNRPSADRDGVVQGLKDQGDEASRALAARMERNS